MTIPEDSLNCRDDGQTPLDDDDRRGLKPTHVSTRGELDEVEQANILKCQSTIRQPTLEVLLDDRYLRALHKAMFGDVWTWAGTYRRRETTIGIDPVDIPVAVRNVVADAATWFDFESAEVAAVRLHHRLVVIHPFPNGNGRFARLTADLAISSTGMSPFSWGAKSASQTSLDVRRTYLASLRAADRGSFSELEAFVRS